MAPNFLGSSHPIVRDVSAARRGVGPRSRGRIAIDGLWAHEHALAQHADVDIFLHCPEFTRTDRARACAERMHRHARQSYLIPPRILARLGGAEPGLISTIRLRDWSPDTFELDRSALVLVADGIEYAGNLGSLIRTADGCAADCLVLTSSRARRHHPKVFTASRGTVLSLPVLEFATVGAARAWLGAAGAQVVLADPEAGRDYRRAEYGTGRTAVVVGSEGRGISREWYGDAQVVAIPMLGNADSLNVATSAGILLYEARARKEGYTGSVQNGRTSTDPKCATG